MPRSIAAGTGAAAAAWTHVYRVVRDPRSARLAVFVERVIEGDRLSAACDWAWAGFAA